MTLSAQASALKHHGRGCCGSTACRTRCSLGERSSNLWRIPAVQGSEALKALFGEIRKAKAELEMMKAYLRESEKFKDTDEITGIFIDKIRDVSFQIEDVVDEFMYKLEDDKHGGFAAKMKKRIKHMSGLGDA
ncbi:unnamed protein product [Miscanthus lutarioriparius]|uniref:Disease resistance N-terminal domain-containing protein n=1 Tax=Miscanthus lutarioriparius TaxID=422564 RepID=A0A811Q1V8_9POAL|nr:unnamed protein product [Miscanthus lutarioriparius]